MKYSIIKNIRCPHVRHPNFKGTYTYESMEKLSEHLVLSSIWNKEITKDDLPLISMTTFNYNIRAEQANPSMLFALDFDDPGNDIERALEVFKPYSFFLYTTSSHTAEHHKFRVMLKLDESIMNNDESHMVYWIIEERLKEYNLTLDRSCKDISRRFYLPAYNKQGELPVMEYNDGADYPIRNDLAIKLEEKIVEERNRELQLALAKINRLTSTKKTSGPNVDLKISEAQDKFLNSPGHETLGKLIGSLKFWMVSDSEIESWCLSNYHPSTGSCKEEVKNWMNWFKRKRVTTYMEKYGL